MSDIRITCGRPNQGGFDIKLDSLARYAGDLFMMLNQIATEGPDTCRAFVKMYGGCDDVADRLYVAALEIIEA